MATVQDSIARKVPLDGPQLVILDTNAIFNDLIYQLRRERDEGSLIQLTREGAIRLFAADHVLDEVQRKAPTQERRGFSAGELLSLFERSYLPRIRFVDLGADSPEDRVAAVADPDDRPTARLAVLLAPCHVITDDPHLTEAGFGEARSWPELAKSVDRTKELDQLVLICIELVKQAGRRLLPWLQRQVRDSGPLEVGMGIGMGLVVLAVLPASGHARLDRAISGGGKLLTEVGLTTLSLGRDWAGERARHSSYLRDVAVRPDQPLALDQRVATTLAVEGPLTAAAVAARLATEVPAVEAVLRSSPAFGEGE